MKSLLFILPLLLVISACTQAPVGEAFKQVALENSEKTVLKNHDELVYYEEGIITKVHFDDFVNPENSRDEFYLIVGDKSLKVENDDELPLVGGLKVKFSSNINNNLDTIASSDLEMIGVEEFDIKQFNSGENKVLVLVSEYDDNPILFPMSEVERYMFGPKPSVADFFYENSYGNTWITGNVIGSFSIGSTTPDCESLESSRFYSDTVESLSLAYAETIVDLTEYKRIVLIHNYVCDDFGGLSKGLKEYEDGSIRSTTVYNSRYQHETVNKDNFIFIVNHELGHDFGAGHSNLAWCTNSFGEDYVNCNSATYGNPFSVMGVGENRHFTAHHKNEFGWINSETYIEQNQGVYQLSPVETMGGIKQIRVPYPNPMDPEFDWDIGLYPDPSVSMYYSLEYRQFIGYDEHNVSLYGGNSLVEKYGEGVFIQFVASLPINALTSFFEHEHLIDPKQASAGVDIEYLDAAQNDREIFEDRRYQVNLLENEGFYDNNIGQSINVLSTTSDFAEIELIKDPVGCTRDFAKVSVLGDLVFSSGSSTVLDVSVPRVDSVACGPSYYEVEIVAPSGVSVSPSSFVASNSFTSGNPILPIGSTHQVTVGSSILGSHSLKFNIKNRDHFYFKNSDFSIVQVSSSNPSKPKDKVVLS